MKNRWMSRIFWLVALWGGSVLALAVVGSLFRNSLGLHISSTFYWSTIPTALSNVWST